MPIARPLERRLEFRQPHLVSDELFHTLGIRWDQALFPIAAERSDPARVVKRFLRSLPQFVWEAAQLEGNPYTFPEVQMLLDGITVGGRKLSDTQQILGLRDNMRLLVDSVVSESFAATRRMACELNALIARKEALEWGHFRGEGKERSNVGVALGAHSYRPKSTEPGGGNLMAAFEAGVSAMNSEVSDPVERAFALKLFMTREKFFFDGNKRTARAMMNGELMRHGFDGLSIPAKRQLEYNEATARFYPQGDASEMMRFLSECMPE
jgi:Fic family protein